MNLVRKEIAEQRNILLNKHFNAYTTLQNIGKFWSTDESGVYLEST